MTTKVHSLTLITLVTTDSWAVAFNSEVHEKDGEFVLRRWGDFHQTYLSLKDAVKLAFSRDAQVSMRVDDSRWTVHLVNDEYEVLALYLSK